MKRDRWTTKRVRASMAWGGAGKDPAGVGKERAPFDPGVPALALVTRGQDFLPGSYVTFWTGSGGRRRSRLDEKPVTPRSILEGFCRFS